jgi:hypothetical protein
LDFAKESKECEIEFHYFDLCIVIFLSVIWMMTSFSIDTPSLIYPHSKATFSLIFFSLLPSFFPKFPFQSKLSSLLHSKKSFQLNHIEDSNTFSHLLGTEKPFFAIEKISSFIHLSPHTNIHKGNLYVC